MYVCFHASYITLHSLSGLLLFSLDLSRRLRLLSRLLRDRPNPVEPWTTAEPSSLLLICSKDILFLSIVAEFETVGAPSTCICGIDMLVVGEVVSSLASLPRLDSFEIVFATLLKLLFKKLLP